MMFRGRLQFNPIPVGKRSLPVQGGLYSGFYPSRGLFRSLSSFFFIAFAPLLIIILQRQENPYVLAAQHTLIAATSPLLTWTEKPLQMIQNIQLHMTSKQDLILENDRLKTQNQHLIRKNQETAHFSLENQQLRQALNVSKGLSHFHTTGRVVGHRYNGAYSSLIISAPDLGPIKKDSVVLSTTGALVGRVTSDNSRKADILSVMNSASRIPVKLENAGGNAVLTGNNKGPLKLLYVENMTSVKVGMKLLTSGFGGIFPPDIPVAEVTAIQGDVIYATPLINSGDVDHVLLLT